MASNKKGHAVREEYDAKPGKLVQLGYQRKRKQVDSKKKLDKQGLHISFDATHIAKEEWDLRFIEAHGCELARVKKQQNTCRRGWPHFFFFAQVHGSESTL